MNETPTTLTKEWQGKPADERVEQELVKQVDGIPVEALRRQAEGLDGHPGTAGPQNNQSH